MRTIITHDYDTVRIDIVWDTIWNGRPTIVPGLQRILNQEVEAS